MHFTYTHMLLINIYSMKVWFYSHSLKNFLRPFRSPPDPKSWPSSSSACNHLGRWHSQGKYTRPGLTYSTPQPLRSTKVQLSVLTEQVESQLGQPMNFKVLFFFFILAYWKFSFKYLKVHIMTEKLHLRCLRSTEALKSCELCKRLIKDYILKASSVTFNI